MTTTFAPPFCTRAESATILHKIENIRFDVTLWLFWWRKTVILAWFFLKYLNFACSSKEEPKHHSFFVYFILTSQHSTFHVKLNYKLESLPTDQHVARIMSCRSANHNMTRIGPPAINRQQLPTN